MTDPAKCTDIGGPAAIKLLSPDVPHKTDAGMVRLNVGPAELRAAVKTLLEDARAKLPRAKIDGVLVQRMERGLAEVIIGYRRDPESRADDIARARRDHGGIEAQFQRAARARQSRIRA